MIKPCVRVSTATSYPAQRRSRCNCMATCKSSTTSIGWRLRENIPGGVIGKWAMHAHSRLPRHLWAGMSADVL